MARRRPKYYLRNQANAHNPSAEFKALFKDALLITLLEKNFLTSLQYERCAAKIKKQK